MPNNPQLLLKKPQMIKNDVYIFYGMNVNWEGSTIPSLFLDGENMVLVGYPSAQDFFKLITAISSVSQADKLKYIIALEITSQFKAVMSLFSNANLYPKIITSKANIMLFNTDDIKHELIYIEDLKNELVFSSGRVIKFISTPFVRTPGAFMVYDALSKVMFSNYLFETRERYLESGNDSKWLYDAIQMIRMMIPSSDFLRPVIEQIAALPTEVVITATNKVIFKSRLENILTELAKLEFSQASVRLSISEDYYHNYSEAINNMILILINTFGKDIVSTVLNDSPFQFDDNLSVKKLASMTESELWNGFFDYLYAKQGLNWIAILEPHVKEWARQHDFALPKLYSSSMIEAERQNSIISIEKANLESKITALEKQLERTVDRLMKDPLTHSFNEIFLKEYLSDEIGSRLKEGFFSKDIALIYINIDNILRLNAKYSKEIGDETIQNLGYLLNQIKKEGDIVFKRNAPGFIYFANKQEELAMTIAKRIQNSIRESDVFVEKITASLSIVKLSEFSPTDPIPSIVDQMLSLGENRIKIGAIKGTNMIIDAQTKIDKPVNGRILIADDELINLSLLKSMFFHFNYEIITAKDGEEALKKISQDSFDCVIAERNLPKTDGLTLKLKMNDQTINAKALYVLLTYNKNKETILRANQLGIDYVMQKPILFEELLGYIQRSIKSRRMQV